MTSKLRMQSKVVMGFTEVLCNLGAIGVAVEPIATMADPDNDIEGDYAIRGCFHRKTPGGADETKLYCAIFEASFVMENLRRMPEDQFKYNLTGLRDAAKTFIKTLETSKPSERVLVESDRVTSMADVKRRAENWPGLKD